MNLVHFRQVSGFAFILCLYHVSNALIKPNEIDFLETRIIGEEATSTRIWVNQGTISFSNQKTTSSRESF